MKWKRSKKAASEARHHKDDVTNAHKKNDASSNAQNVMGNSGADGATSSLGISGEQHHTDLDDDDNMSSENIDVTEIDEDDDDFDHDDMENMSDDDDAGIPVSMTSPQTGIPLSMTMPESGMPVGMPMTLGEGAHSGIPVHMGSNSGSMMTAAEPEVVQNLPGFHSTPEVRSMVEPSHG